MKIALAYLPTKTPGDYDDYLAQLSAALADLGHTVTRHGSPPSLSSFRDCDTHTSSHSPHTARVLPGRPAASSSEEQLSAVLQQFAQHLVTAWEADRPDIVHAHHWAAALATELAAQRLGIPVVVTYFPSPQHPSDSAKEPRVGRALARHANRLLALNTAHATQLTRLGRPRAHMGLPRLQLTRGV